MELASPIQPSNHLLETECCGFMRLWSARTRGASHLRGARRPTCSACPSRPARGDHKAPIRGDHRCLCRNRPLAAAPQPNRKSGSPRLDFANWPFHILMRVMKTKGEKETVQFPGERLLDVG